MNRRSIIAAAAVFIILTAARFCLPASSQYVDKNLKILVEYDVDYGRSLRRAPDKTADVVSADRTSAAPYTLPAYKPRTIAEVKMEQFPPLTVAVSADETTDDDNSAAEEKSDAQSEAVAVFLHSQEAFSDYELPENVSYMYSTLPFDYSVPVSGTNSSGFGYRLHPILNEVKFHYGTDIAAWTGVDVHAFADGTVSFSGYSESYGNYIVIEHSDGWKSLYAHCSTLYVSSGDNVSAGDIISLVGATGAATGPHLHFELMHDGIYINPEYYINAL